MKEKKILVLGATGQQGGAAVRHLIKDGWKVRAFVRDLSSDKAKKLSQLGAELALGDMEDLATVDAAMQGMYGVFSVQPPDWNPSRESNDHEKRIGKAIVDSAKKANIQHFVYASVGGADGQAWIRDAKWEIEQYIQSLGLPATILRPATFMENFSDPMSAGLQNGAFTQAFKSDGALPLIAVDDIGAIVALAFRSPEDYMDKTIELAGDKVTPLQIADAIGRITNRAIPYVQIPIETFRQQSEILANVFQWVSDGGHKVDLAEVRELFPEMMDFDTWVKRQGKEKFEALFHPELA